MPRDYEALAKKYDVPMRTKEVSARIVFSAADGTAICADDVWKALVDMAEAHGWQFGGGLTQEPDEEPTD